MILLLLNHHFPSSIPFLLSIIIILIQHFWWWLKIFFWVIWGGRRRRRQLVVVIQSQVFILSFQWIIWEWDAGWWSEALWQISRAGFGRWVEERCQHGWPGGWLGCCYGVTLDVDSRWWRNSRLFSGRPIVFRGGLLFPTRQNAVALHALIKLREEVLPSYSCKFRNV